MRHKQYYFLANALKLQKKSRQVMAVAALLGGISSIGARAQGPDYSNVNDFLSGRRTLLAIDDLVVSGIDASGKIYTSTTTTTNSQLDPATTSSVCCQLNSVIKTLTGHMFNLPSATTVELVTEPTASQIRLPFVGNKGTGIQTPAGLIGGAMADFNGDGYDDLVLYFKGGGIQVFFAADVNDPAQRPHLYSGPVSPLDTLLDMTVGDFNGDGRPEIAGLMYQFGELRLVIYTVDPTTLVVSKASQITLYTDNRYQWPVGVSIASGRFTPAAHNQIVVAYVTPYDSEAMLKLIDFAPSSLIPQEKAGFRIYPGSEGGVIKLKTNKFGLPANPYDQVVFMFAYNDDRQGRYLRILSIDPATLAWTSNSLWDMSSLPCVFDISVGNFDNRQPDPANPGQTQHNFNDQIAVFYGACSNGQRNLAILNADPDKFSMSLASVKPLPFSFNGAISLSFTESDTQGRSMVLGDPTKITLSSNIQPSVVIGVPPMHVDFVSPDPLDGAPPHVLNLSAVPDGYKATYDQENSSSHKSGSTNTSSWSFSAKQSLGGSVTFGDPDEASGLKIKDTQKAAQDIKHAAEQAHGTSKRMAFDLSATTGFGDEVSYIDSEFNIWVYPVIGKSVCPAKKPNCSDTERVPLTIQFSAPNGDALTQATQGQALQWYQPPWEPGNIFSYPATLKQLQSIYPNLDLLTTEGEGVGFLTDTSTVTQKTSWSVTTKDTATTSSDDTYSEENDVSTTGAIGLKGLVQSKASFKLDLGGSDGFSSLSKHTTDLGASTGVQVSKPGTFPTFQNYGYQVAPYLMGTTKPGGYVDSQPLSTDVQTFGVLRAMFTANPLADDAGGWWGQAYTHPDVALNHPSRWQISTSLLRNSVPRNCLATGTGASLMDCAKLTPRSPENPWLSVFHQLRGFFISSALSPGKGPQLEQATAGEVLTLQTRVYNYSLALMPSGSQVHVRFYFMPVKNTRPAGDSVLIEEEELDPIPPFNNTSPVPNWVLASTTFDTSKYEQTRNGNDIVFWVMVWMQKQDGTLVKETPGHGLTGIPGTLTSLADAAKLEECQPPIPNPDPSQTPIVNCYSNNVGFYRQAFHIAQPVTGFVGAPPPAGPASIDISNVDLSADRIKPDNTIVVSATLGASKADASGVSANFYDGDPQQGGRLFDVQRIPHIAQDDPYLLQASYQTNTCGTHEVFVVVNRGKSSEVVRQSHPVRVDCDSPK